jgi:hypothetical protein
MDLITPIALNPIVVVAVIPTTLETILVVDFIGELRLETREYLIRWART